MKMKRFLAALMVGCFGVAGLSGCGGSDTSGVLVDGNGHTSTVPAGGSGSPTGGGTTTGGDDILPSGTGGTTTGVADATTGGTTTGGSGEETTGTGGTTTGTLGEPPLPPAAVCVPKANERIAFVSKRYKNTANVFVTDDCTGDSPIQVTKNEDTSSGGGTILSSQTNPVFRPDGKQLAFSQAEIAILLIIPVPLGFGTTFWNVDGSNVSSDGLLDLNFTGDNGADFLPSSFTWDSSGKKFAVISAIINKKDNDSKNLFPKEIRVGSDVSDLTEDNFKVVVKNNKDNTLDFGKVAWIDDNTLAYSVKDGDGKWDIAVASVSGENNPSGNLLADEDKNESDPAPSRDGKKLAFTRGGQIYSCDLGVQTIALPEQCPDTDPFNFKMCTVDHKFMTCTNEVRLTADYDNSGPCFSYDGKYIFFTSNHPHDGGKTDSEIWRMTADGADLTDVSNNDAKDDNVACGPAPEIKFRNMTPVQKQFQFFGP